VEADIHHEHENNSRINYLTSSFALTALLCIALWLGVKTKIQLRNAERSLTQNKKSLMVRLFLPAFSHFLIKNAFRNSSSGGRSFRRDGGGGGTALSLSASQLHVHAPARRRASALAPCAHRPA